LRKSPPQGFGPRSKSLGRAAKNFIFLGCKTHTI